MAAPSSQSFQRLVRGATYVNNYPATSGIQTNVGDLMLLMSGNVLPCSQFPMLSGNEIQSWSGARSQFLGVSLSQWDNTNVRSGDVRVAGNGIFQYPFPAASGTSYVPGTFVSFTQDQSSGFLQPQEIMQCSGQATAIGKVVEFFTPNASGYGLLTVYLQGTIPLGTITNT